MPNERIIAKMKLVKQNQKRMQSKAEHRRSKVIAKLEEQLAMAEALCRNEPFAIKKHKWVTNSFGERVAIETHKRLAAHWSCCSRKARQVILKVRH